jgi:hypothetical protein
VKLEVHDGSGTSAQVVKINSGGVGLLSIQSGTHTDSRIEFGDSANDDAGYIYYENDNEAMRFGVNANERMRIDSSGRLLVGTSGSFNGGRLCIGSGQGSNTPSGEHVKLAPSVNRIEFLDSSSNASDTGSISLWNTVYNNRSANIALFHDAVNTGSIKFETHNGSSLTERMKIHSSGNVGINITNPTAQLHVYDEGGQAVIKTDIINSASQFTYAIQGLFGGSTTFQVLANGNCANTNNSFGAISDAKLKENIVDANSQWDDIKKIRVRNYNLIEGQTHTQIGVVAQEVETVSPGLVNTLPDRDSDGDELETSTKVVNYSVLYMKAVKALQEAMERIETLEQRLSDAGIA